MRLYYYKDPQHNFGDDLNGWLWDKLIPGGFDNDNDEWMSVIGSIIHDDMPPAKKKIIFSSGAGQSFPPENFGDDSWNVICVRGPLTEKVLGLPENKYVTDGAILLAGLPEYQPLPEEERSGTVFMPHHASLDYGQWEEACALTGIEFISPRDDFLDTLDRIRRAKLVLSDAMHAAIVADTMRVPWIPIVASPKINGFKWLDWTLSMSLPYEPVIIPSSNLSEKAARFVFNAFGGCHPTGKSYEQAVKEYHKYYSNRRKAFAKYERKMRKASALLLKLLMEGYTKTSLGKNTNDRCIKNAAQALKLAAQGKSYLSNQDVFNSKLAEIKRRLKQVEKILEENNRTNNKAA